MGDRESWLSLTFRILGRQLGRARYVSLSQLRALDHRDRAMVISSESFNVFPSALTVSSYAV